MFSKNANFYARKTTCANPMQTKHTSFFTDGLIVMPIDDEFIHAGGLPS
jgi:hypothetical protein